MKGGDSVCLPGESGCGAKLRWGSQQLRLRGGLPLGFHLNNQLTQALTSRYRDSRLRVDFERFVSCVAQLTFIFRECHPWHGWGRGRVSPMVGELGRWVLTPPLSAQATVASTWMGVRVSSA